MTAYGYDGEDRLISVTDANGHTRTLSYDLDGRLVSATDALNHATSFQYDAVGNLTATVDALGITNRVTAYDPRNQPISTQDALGNTKRLSYDDLQRLTQTVDALSRTNSFLYDPLSRLTNSIDPMSFSTQQQFDGEGNRTAVINPKLAQTSFAYDLADRLLTDATPTGKTTSYSYDGRNLVTKMIQPSGAQTTLTYDGAARLIQSQDAAGTIIYTYDNKGRVLTISESGITLTRQYDALDRLTNYTDAFGNVIQYAYDAVGNLTNLTYPGGNNVAYGYDAANRLTSVTDWLGNVTTYAYDSDNRITNIAHPNGTATTKTYDVDGRVSQQQDIWAGSNVVYQVNYTYDSVGQIIEESNQPPATPYQPAAVTMTFDADNALISYNGQTVTNDQNGNMVYGPLITGSLGAFTYDARNRLTEAGGITYAYDPAGILIALTNHSKATEFVIDPNAALSQILMRTQSSVTDYYVYGYGLLYQITPTNGTNAVLTYHFDYRGSTVAITSGNGNVTDQVSYSPYGGTVSRFGATDTPFLFNGAYAVMTEPNGLLNMRARHYSSTICRFSTPDPMGFSASINFYVYAADNPVSLIDPKGLDVTITLYPGYRPFGHIGIAVNSPVTLGFNPRTEYGPGSLVGQAPGVFIVDTSEPVDSVTIHTSPDQDKAVLEALNQAVATPPNYNLLNENCAEVASDILNQAGIPVPRDPFPADFLLDVKEYNSRLQASGCNIIQPHNDVDTIPFLELP